MSNKYRASYKWRKLYKDTYAIRDNGGGIGSVYMYLLVGTEKALLIDSGYGMNNLKEITQAITDKEVICVCTHGHLDHVLGAYQFEKAYLHSKDNEVYQMHTNSDRLRKMCYTGLFYPLRDKTARDARFRENVEKIASKEYGLLRPLETCKEFELGDRLVTWRRLPGHTQGSTVFIDEKFKTVFEGDSAGVGLWLFLEESSPLSQFVSDVGEYLVFLEKKQINRRYMGHMSLPLRTTDLRRLIRCCRYAIQNPQKGKIYQTVFGQTRQIIKYGTEAYFRIDTKNGV